MLQGHRLKIATATLLVSAALGGAIGGAYALNPSQTSDSAPPPALLAPVSATTAPAALGLPDMRSIVASQGPAVVNISVTGTRKTGYGGPQIDPDDPFFQFFRQFRGAIPQDSTPVRSQGSGFIVSADGTILTNAHVVDDADEVTVKLNDKREFKAKVLGLDTASDVAVLKIDGQNLPTVRIGRSQTTQVGEWVLAIGSPFGFESSASAGIVSAKSRSLPDGIYVPFIQTDVAVNPGNSGGPLFNMNGEVIGINSQIYSRSGGYQGLSFAIPIEVAMNVERQIVTHGKVERGRMGVTIQEINQALADSFGLDKPRGALVAAVEKGGPAAKAGLEAGDVILAVDGQNIQASGELPALIAAKRPGEVVNLQVWRNKTSRNVAVSVGSFSAEKPVVASKDSANKGRLGVAVRPLSPAEQQQADIDGGLLIEQVSGPAARAGLRPGDILLSINGQALRSVEQLRTALEQSGKKATLLIERGDSRLFVAVDLA